MQKENKKLKCYVVWGSSSEATSWLNCDVTHNEEEADFALFTGGSDIDPKFYNQRKLKGTYTFPERDIAEKKAFDFFKSRGIPMIGICRGLQLLNALSGGDMWQDIAHHGGHFITLDDGSELHVNSLHHQLVMPYNMPKDEYIVLGVCTNGSPYHINDKGRDEKENTLNRDPEIVFYPKTKSFGVQFHPEMMDDRTVNNVLHAYIKKYLGLDLSFTNDPITDYLKSTEDKKLKWYNPRINTTTSKSRSDSKKNVIKHQSIDTTSTNY